MKKIKVLSVKQPWAWCIFNAGKDVENRTWETIYRGELYIHASKKFDWGAYTSMIERSNNIPQNMKLFETGGIIGKVDLVSCVYNHESNWAQKDMCHWVFEYPVQKIFKRCNGQLKIYNLEVDWV